MKAAAGPPAVPAADVNGWEGGSSGGFAGMGTPAGGEGEEERGGEFGVGGGEGDYSSMTSSASRWQATSERIRRIQEVCRGRVHVPAPQQTKHLRILVVRLLCYAVPCHAVLCCAALWF